MQKRELTGHFVAPYPLWCLYDVGLKAKVGMPGAVTAIKHSDLKDAMIAVFTDNDLALTFLEDFKGPATLAFLAVPSPEAMLKIANHFRGQSKVPVSHVGIDYDYKTDCVWFIPIEQFIEEVSRGTSEDVV